MHESHRKGEYFPFTLRVKTRNGVYRTPVAAYDCVVTARKGHSLSSSYALPYLFTKAHYALSN